MVSKFNRASKKEGLEKIDQELCAKLNFYEDVDELVDSAFSSNTVVCSIAFKLSRGAKHEIKKKELTVLRKRTNALRRRYQSTTNNANLIQDRKAKCFDGRREYEG